MGYQAADDSHVPNAKVVVSTTKSQRRFDAVETPPTHQIREDYPDGEFDADSLVSIAKVCPLAAYPTIGTAFSAATRTVAPKEPKSQRGSSFS